MTDDIAKARPVRSLAERVDMYALVLSATLLLTVVVAAIGGSGGGGSQIGGDYPAFYGAGRIVLEGDADSLYDAARQAEAQRQLLAEPGGYLYFAYPPFTAAAYALPSALPYGWSVALQVMLSALAIGAAVWLVRKEVPFVVAHPAVAFAAALFFYPMLRSVVGGQNTALTLLLLCAAASLEREERPLLAGVMAAMLLFKPQFGIPIAMLLVVARKWRVLEGWLIGAAGLYVIGAAVAGPAWIGTWWESATSFADANLAINGGLFVSLPGLLAHLAPASSLASAAGWLWSGAIAIGAAYVWWRFPGDAALRYATAAAALVAVLPQPLYYEVGLLLLPVALMAARLRASWLFAAFWLAGIVELFDGPLGFSPLAIVAAMVAIAAWWWAVLVEQRHVARQWVAR